MEYPDSIHTLKQKLAYRFFFMWYTFDAGKGRAFGRFSTQFNDFLLWYIALKTSGISAPFWVWAVVVVVGIVVLYYLGVLYLRYDLDKIESTVAIERNVFQKQLYNKMISKKERRI